MNQTQHLPLAKPVTCYKLRILVLLIDGMILMVLWDSPKSPSLVFSAYTTRIIP
ncbi:hypothetical protein [Nostoc sp. PA-18-2419]|uniref:hypothetical protein n=1 Tax=Nostoc sp. PA-18-2419 TaxID=2575443 RepID=UPI001673406F|nr:hypothetical protein [Nostoc sp. PA-18-2419]